MEKVRMLSTLGLMGAMRSLSSAFEAATGIHVDADFAPTLALLKRLRDGEAADLVGERAKESVRILGVDQRMQRDGIG